jgi:hypothetical protein
MLGDYPEYMNGVVAHMRNLRNKWQQGLMLPSALDASPSATHQCSWRSTIFKMSICL